VNLGVRMHRHRELLRLGVMAREVLAAALARCHAVDAPNVEAEKYCQFVQERGDWLPRWAEVLLEQRPPLKGIDSVEMPGIR
jgi:glucosyl-3-phosphoglycerate synthase